MNPSCDGGIDGSGIFCVQLLYCGQKSTLFSLTPTKPNAKCFLRRHSHLITSRGHSCLSRTKHIADSSQNRKKKSWWRVVHPTRPSKLRFLIHPKKQSMNDFASLRSRQLRKEKRSPITQHSKERCVEKIKWKTGENGWTVQAVFLWLRTPFAQRRR